MCTVAWKATASDFTLLHCTLSVVGCKWRYVESKSARGQLSGMNLLVTRSKVFLSSGFGRTWHVRRFNLAGARLIYREKWKKDIRRNVSFFFFFSKVMLIRDWIPDVESSSVFTHRAVWNCQAAKFHSTLSLLPHLPDSGEWIPRRGEKWSSCERKQESVTAHNI